MVALPQKHLYSLSHHQIPNPPLHIRLHPPDLAALSAIVSAPPSPHPLAPLIISSTPEPRTAAAFNWQCVIILFAHYCSFYAVAAGWSSTASYTRRVTSCPIYIHPTTSVAARLCPHTSSCAHVMQQIMIMVISTHFWRHRLVAIGIHRHLTH